MDKDVPFYFNRFQKLLKFSFSNILIVGGTRKNRELKKKSLKHVEFLENIFFFSLQYRSLCNYFCSKPLHFELNFLR